MNLCPIIEQELKVLALQEYPQEACALIFASGKVEKIKNISENSKTSFSLCPEEFLKAVLKHSGESFSLWHSHTRKEVSWMDIRTPSEKDILLAYEKEVKLYISGFDGQTYSRSVCFPKALEPEYNYLNRPYIPGIYDCGTLAVDFFYLNFGIKLKYKFLPEYLNPANWSKAVETFLLENKFYRIERSLLKKYDIICINYFHQKEAHGVLVISDELELLDQREISSSPAFEDIIHEAASFWRWDKEVFLGEKR